MRVEKHSLINTGQLYLTCACVGVDIIALIEVGASFKRCIPQQESNFTACPPLVGW